MKLTFKLFVSALLLTLSSASFGWWGNNGWGNWNPYPVWTPMYWADEMFDNNDYYTPYPYGYPGYAYGGYPYTPYGYGAYPAYGYGTYPAYGSPYGYPGGWGAPGWGW